MIAAKHRLINKTLVFKDTYTRHFILFADESIPPAMWEHSFRKGHTFSGSLYDSIKDLFLPWNRKE